MSWDLFCKALVKECSQDFVEYFVPGARFVGLVEGQLQTRVDSSFDPREIRSDVVPEAKYEEKNVLVDVEWQSSRDEKIAERLLGYSHELTRLHGIAVRSVVIYTQPVSGAPESPLERIIPCKPLPDGNLAIRFQFASLEVYEKSVVELRALNLDAFSVLMLLCHDGATPAVLDEILERLFKRKSGRRETIAVAFFFASKVLVSEEDQKYLERKRKMTQDTLRESWLYQQVLSEGREEGLAEGRAEGLVKGISEGRAEGLARGLARGISKGLAEGRAEQARQAIADLVEDRSPDLLVWVKEQIERVTDLEALRAILRSVARASTVEEIRAALPVQP